MVNKAQDRGGGDRQQHTEDAEEVAEDDARHEDQKARHAEGVAEKLRLDDIGIEGLEQHGDDKEKHGMPGINQHQDKAAYHAADDRAEVRHQIRHRHDHGHEAHVLHPEHQHEHDA